MLPKLYREYCTCVSHENILQMKVNLYNWREKEIGPCMQGYSRILLLPFFCIGVSKILHIEHLWTSSDYATLLFHLTLLHLTLTGRKNRLIDQHSAALFVQGALEPPQKQHWRHWWQRWCYPPASPWVHWECFRRGVGVTGKVWTSPRGVSGELTFWHVDSWVPFCFCVRALSLKTTTILIF